MLSFFIQGKYLEQNEEFNNAKLAYSNSIKFDKFFFQSYLNLLRLYEKTNDIIKLSFLIDEALKIFKKGKNVDIITLYSTILLNRKKNYNESQKIIKKKNLLNKFKNEKLYLTILLDIESKNLEKMGKYNEAYEKVKKEII